MLTGQMMPRPQRANFGFTLGRIVLVTAFCFSGLGKAFVGKEGMAMWDDTIGMWRFGLVYCFAAPVIGYIAAFIVAQMLAPKEPFTT